MITARDLYTPTFPLGPHISPDNMDRAQLELLFDADNKLVNQLNHEKALIIGRKGSGKTTLLTSVQLSDQKGTHYYLPASDIFAQIVREINTLSGGVVFVEQVSRLWDFVFWGVVFHHIAKFYDDPQLTAYCQALEITNEETPYEVIARMLEPVPEICTGR